MNRPQGGEAEREPLPYLVERHCPVCGSETSREVFVQPTEHIAGIGDIGYHHRIRMCGDCGFVFAAPILDESAIARYYETMSNYEHPESEGLRPVEEIRQVERQVEIITARFEDGFVGRALDIGCSIALTLSKLQARGWEVLGLDPSDTCIEVSQRELGVRVRKGLFSPELLKDQSPFDVIILSHVLEHLVHPAVVLRQLRELLSPGGRVYIEVPDLMKPFGVKCYFGFEHVNYFTPTSLTNLLLRCGFDVDTVDTFDNGREVCPYYPVVAATARPAPAKPGRIRNDGLEAMAVIRAYQREASDRAARLSARISEIVDQTDPGRLALWGAGIHTSQLLSETDLGAASVRCIFDNDPKKAGGRIKGIPIETFPDDPRKANERVDAILISSEAHETAIFEQLRYLEAWGIAVYRLYEGHQAGKRSGL